MEELIKQLGSFWGPAGIIVALQALVIAYLYKAREDDRKAFDATLAAERKAYDAALKESTDENTETLKLIIPLVQKLTSTMDATLPILLTKIHGGEK